jgi:hypothetical protein
VLPVGLSGLPRIVVSGATVSTVQVKVSAALRLPAASIARTSNLCAPSARPEMLCPDAIGANPPPSSCASNLATPLPSPSSPLKLNEAVAFAAIVSGVPVSSVVGAIVSTVQA